MYKHVTPDLQVCEANIDRIRGKQNSTVVVRDFKSPSLNF